MKEKFIQIFNEHITREGADKLLAWLEKSDFFTAPASTRFHGAYEGGLVEHCVNVFEQLEALVMIETSPVKMNPTIESIAIIGLLHDVCKINFYTQEERNKKVDGKWIQVPYFGVDEKFAFGHGEKSVFLIERFIKLTMEEAVSIRFHMGAYEGQHSFNNLSIAYKNYPLSMLTHFADMRANYFIESTKK